VGFTFHPLVYIQGCQSTCCPSDDVSVQWTGMAFCEEVTDENLKAEMAGQ
jgi:hypothetical protein